MRHLLEAWRQVASHALRRRQRVEKLLMLRLQILQAAHHVVIFFVADSRLVKHIVVVVVLVEFLPQPVYFRFKQIHISNYFATNLVKFIRTQADLPLFFDYSKKINVTFVIETKQTTVWQQDSIP